MYNLSVGDCMIHYDRTIPLKGDRVNVLLADQRPICGTIAWQIEHFCGVSFDHFLDIAVVLSLGFPKHEYGFGEMLPHDRFGRNSPVFSGRLPFWQHDPAALASAPARDPREPRLAGDPCESAPVPFGRSKLTQSWKMLPGFGEATHDAALR